VPVKTIPVAQVFTFLFLMLGPFKIIGPFAKITQGADPALTRKLAVTAIIYSTIALLLAGFLGQSIMSKYGIPLPILGLSGGIILFLVALLNIIHQFTPGSDKEDKVTTPTMNMAMHPLAFPTIVTPYGIAAVIIFLAMFPDLRLYIGLVVLAMMVLNLIIMLITRYIYKSLAVILALLGAILGIIQVALGLMIIYNQLNNLLKM
jgi:multiple antibiotic resistance protein